MSSDDTKTLAEIINGILNPDNATRNQAVQKLEVLRQNTPVLIYHLFKIIQGNLIIYIFSFSNKKKSFLIFIFKNCENFSIYLKLFLSN